MLYMIEQLSPRCNVLRETVDNLSLIDIFWSTWFKDIIVTLFSLYLRILSAYNAQLQIKCIFLSDIEKQI